MANTWKLLVVVTSFDSLIYQLKMIPLEFLERGGQGADYTFCLVYAKCFSLHVFLCWVLNLRAGIVPHLSLFQGFCILLCCVHVLDIN